MLPEHQEWLTAYPDYRHLEQWPTIDLSLIHPKYHSQVKRNLGVMADYLHGESVKNIAQRFNLSQQAVYELTHKALDCSLKERPRLSKALIPYQVRKLHQRSKNLPTLIKPSGTACSFSQIMQSVEGLEPFLLNKIKAKLKHKEDGENYTITTLHKNFLQYLRDHQWPVDQYPFTVKSLGYQSFRTWLIKQETELQAPVFPKRTIQPKILEEYLLEELQMDEQLTDITSKVWIEHDGQYFSVRLSRCSLLLLIDKRSELIISYLLVVDRFYDQDDVLSMLNQLVYPEDEEETYTCNELAPLTEEQKDFIKSLPQMQVGQVALDNALAHLGDSVNQLIVNEWDAIQNFGLIKMPKRRSLVEYAFNRLNKTVHRLPSTTGSHIYDPKREPAHRAKKAPRIQLKELETMIRVVIAETNQKARSNLGCSPLEKATQLYQQGAYWNRPAPPPKRFGCFTRSRIVTLHVNTTEKRRPYYYFDSIRYTLQNMEKELKRLKKVRVWFDSRDIRKMEVTTLDGDEIGVALVAKTWQRYPHSRKTRRRALKHVKNCNRNSSDPHMNYFNDAAKQHDSQKNALELVRLYREINFNPSSRDLGRRVTTVDCIEPASRNKFSWSSSDV
ncbi:MAG: hypothetical protein CMP47_10355 [Rickettsiales bacterium]|nr:hypothetical protein [Rickettsiales bacterium]